MTLYHRDYDDPELGRVVQYIELGQLGVAIGWEIYPDGVRSADRFLDGENADALASRGFREVT